MRNEFIVLSILIPCLMGLYTYALIKFKEQGNNKLIGWKLALEDGK